MDLPALLGILGLSLRVALAATLLNLPGALAAAWLLARRTFRGKALLEGLIHLPLVLPPVVTGYLLLLLLGRNGLLGAPMFSLFGLRIAFTTAAAVLAAMVVSFPLTVRSIRVALEMADPGLEAAAATLGAPRRDVWRRITLPLAGPGLAAGLALGFARSMGEFGATMAFAGSIPGVSRTVPLAVHAFIQVPGRETEAAMLTALSVAVSLGALYLSARTVRRAA